MRFKNEKGKIKLYAVAGTQTVLLSFDIDFIKLKDSNFLGFDIERKNENGKIISLNGSKQFKSLIKNNSTTNIKKQNFSLVQSFFWKDYLADPGQKYTYEVKAMFGVASDCKPKYKNSITITTEKLIGDKHSVFFNYGITGSQAYAANKAFGNTAIKDLNKASYQSALDFLSRNLYNEGLKKFVAQAKTKHHSLYCAFYEIQYSGFIEELIDVKKKSKNLEIIYSAQPEQNKDSKEKKGNRSSLLNADLISNCHPRTKANQPHNKFMVLCKDEEPIEVWTGSTNITLSGIFGQSNTGHWIKDKAIAKKYKTYWDKLKSNPDMPELSAVSEDIQADANLSNLEKGIYVFFSPRDIPTPKGKTPQQLKSYVDIIDNAKELVCMIFPFNYDDVFKNVYDKKRNYLRYLIFENKEQAHKAKSNSENDVNLKVTAGAVLESNVEIFVKEITPKTTVDGGILYVHNKFFLIDPLSSNPMVLSGSANFSYSSITNNDENSLLIKGDLRVTDIYLTEFNRLFEHFWPRYLHSINKKNKKTSTGGFENYLDETYTWFQDYYETNSYHFKRKQLFIKMKETKKG